MLKQIAIFGSTGSIGKNTVQIIKSYPDLFKVKILTAHSNVNELAKQALELNPEIVFIEDKTKLEELQNLLKNSNIHIYSGSIEELATIKVDIAMMAITGYHAISPTIRSIQAGNHIALANKECLVCAGKLILSLAQKHQVKLIPVDSEHSGLFQIFNFEKPYLIKDVTLTASGGPFRNLSLKEMQNVTKAQALKHPNWNMGEKITIDSATLVNKCLEVIEAYHLFPITKEQIKIIIHPESIVHALVNFTDGSILAQASLPNMQIPISYALFHPKRAVLYDFNDFDFTKLSQLNFFKPDTSKFRVLNLLPAILKDDTGNAALIFNVANEIAVDAFLKDKITFLQIVETIENMLNALSLPHAESPEEVAISIEEVKTKTLNYISQLK